MIEAVNVTRRFPAPGGRGGEVTAVRRVSLAVGDGEIVGLLGPTGCGKSTLLELLAGLLAPTEGRVLIDGALALPPEPSEPRALRAHRRGHLLPPVSNGLLHDRPRHDVAVVFQDHAVFPWMTALGNVAFALRVRGVPRGERRPRAVAALERVGLGDALDRYPAQLSGGMRQRLALARALAVRPRAILMDEPFASVDAATRHQLQDLLLELWAESGVTVVLVTHDVEEAAYLCDRVAVFGAPGTLDRVVPVPAARPRRRPPGTLASLDALLGRPAPATPPRTPRRGEPAARRGA
jgi:NitT/TauT family transport system ATP-binding protein